MSAFASIWMNISHPLWPIALRQRGIEVTTTAEANLPGATDEEQLEFARQSQRLLVTHDDDYLSLHALGIPHAGIAYCRQGTRTIGEMLQPLTLIYELLLPDEVMSKVVYL